MSKRPFEIGRDVIARERDALGRLYERIPSFADAFDEAVQAIVGCSGRVIFCGMGKSGQIGQKISSTMISTGTPASFLHPAEGFHGDVGIVTSKDLVIAISNSGATREVMDLVPTIRNLGAKVIALAGPRESPLARAADIALTWGEVNEADSTGLVPTVSAALTLALGDALTVAAMEARGFGHDEYRLFHPSGSIGTKLTLQVIDLLRGPHTNPCVREDASFGDTLEVMTRHLQGGVNVVDENDRLVGLLTDGDVRRLMQNASGTVADLNATPVGSLMTASPTTTSADTLAIHALRAMENHQPRPIYLLPVVDGEGRAVGLLHVHTLVQAGLAGGADA